MVRRHARHWLILLAACVVGLPGLWAQTRSAPSRPAQSAQAGKVVPFQTVKLRGDDYVDIEDFAKRFKFKLVWQKKNESLTLSDARGVRFSFERDQRDYIFDGMRIFLGDTVLFYKDSLWVTRSDIFKIIGPLLVPGDYLDAFPKGSPKVIVLDPGHGGIDPGTQSSKYKINEKTMALDVAMRVKRLLEARGWKVIMVRSGDKELSKNKVSDLLLRSKVANDANADLFLSIHFNAAPGTVSGIETYTMTPQFMRSTGDYSTGDPMSKTAFPNNKVDIPNLLFGANIHRAMLNELKTSDRGFKRGRWGVLRMLECPGVLVECGYLSNPTEAARIATPAWRQKIAEALAEGVQTYASQLAALRGR